MKDQEKETPTSRQPDGWISVKDWLPNDYDGVLVLIEDGEILYASKAKHIPNDVKITHWMPLPPSPTSEEKETEGRGK